MEDSSPEEESVKALRDALGRLVTDGLVPYNVNENGGFLLELALFEDQREQLDGDADETERNEADAKALRAILQAAVEHKEISGKHRRLLRAVLPLKEELLGRSVRERRAVAGKELKPGKKVGADTIRTYYEPKALVKLATVLWKMELEFQVETTSSHGAHADAKGSAS